MTAKVVQLRTGATRAAERALEAFRACVACAEIEPLQVLRDVLERDPQRLARGSWARLERDPARGDAVYCTCPLTTLFAGRPTGGRDVQRAIRDATDRLRAHGFDPGEFTRPWDRGWMAASALLRIVEEEIASRSRECRPGSDGETTRGGEP